MDINGELLKRIKDLEKRLDALSGQEVLTMTALTDLTDGGATTLHKHSHTGLDDIGTTTHAQIDTFISNATATLTDGWWTRSETWTRLSNTTFRVSGDLTAVFVPGAKIKVTQTSTKYFYVVSSSYSSPNTTVTITGGSDYSLTASPTKRWISYVANPQGFPGWFAYSPTPTGFSSVPETADYRFAIVGRVVTLVVAQKTNGTSNATDLTVPLPVTAATVGTTGTTWTGANGYAVDNGTGLTVASRWVINSGGTTIDFYTNMAVGAWTNAKGKRVYCVATYEI